MAEVANNAQVYNDSYGNSYSLDFSKGYHPDARPDTSLNAYLDTKGLGHSWWNRNFRGSGWEDWAAGVNEAYNDYRDVYNNRWNGLENTFDQYQEMGYNPYYMDKVAPTAPSSSSSGNLPFDTSAERSPLGRIGNVFGQLVGMMSAFNNLRQQQKALDIQDEDLKRIQTENQFLPNYLQSRNDLAGNRLDLGTKEWQIKQLLYDKNALWNDVLHWSFGRPEGYMSFSRGIEDKKYEGTFGAAPYERSVIARDKERVLADIIKKYSTDWAEWENFNKEISHDWDVHEKENFAKLLSNWDKEVANEGLSQEVLEKELNWKSKAFGVDKGFEYLSRLLGLAGQAAGLKASAFQRQLARRRENFFEDTSRMANFGMMPGADYFGNNW